MRVLFLAPAVFLFAQWETPVKLAQLSNPEIHGPPGISASLGGIVHIVWCDQRVENSQIFYRRSEDGGVTWKPEVRLTGTMGNAEDPQVSIAGVMNPVTHVVWVDNRDGNKEIYYKRSTDWGISWSEDARLTNTAGNSDQPVLRGCVCCGTDVRVMWVDDVNGNPDIFYKISSDNGLTWSGDIRITENPSSQLDPSFAFCLSLVQAIWSDRRNGTAEIWGRRSTDGGLTWVAERCFSRGTAGSSAYPAIAHAPDQYDSTLQLFWINRVNTDDPAPAFDVFYHASMDLGLTWEPALRLTEHGLADPAIHPACLALGSVLYAIFKDPGTGIRYRSSFDKGKTWHSDSCAVRLSNARIGDPSVALAGRIMHIAWFDDHAGKLELYYLRNPNGNPMPFE